MRVAVRVPILGLLLLATGCTSSSSTVTSPTSVRCAATLGVSPETMSASGGRGSVTIAIDRECTWDARSDSAWIALGSPASGQGEATLSYTAEANPLVSVRRGAVIVNDQRVEVVQAAAACTFSLSAAGGSVGAEGGVLSVTVTAPATCTWTAASEASFVQVASGREGDGQGTVTLRVEPNGGAARTGGVTIAGQRYTVSQAASSEAGPAPPPPAPPSPTPPSPTPGPPAPPTPGPPPPPETPPPCSFKVSPTMQLVGVGGGDGEVRVEAGEGRCEWTAASNVPWITLTSNAGTGNGRARYIVLPNVGAARSGTLIVAGTTVTVSQDGVPSPQTVMLSGRLSDVDGDCPNLTFRLEGQTVRTNQQTMFDDRCERLRGRRQVTVMGSVQADGSVLALSVRLGR